jgi:hypothetical protein
MPSWKKLITSGSDARLSSLTVDDTITANSYSGDGSSLTGVGLSPLAFNQYVSDAFDRDGNNDYQPIDSETYYVIDPNWVCDSNGDFMPRTRELWGIRAFEKDENGDFEFTANDDYTDWPNQLED